MPPVSVFSVQGGVSKDGETVSCSGVLLIATGLKRIVFGENREGN